MMDLKPCPFCGGTNAEPTMFYTYALGERCGGGDGTETRVVMCMNCRVQGPQRKTKFAAAAAWNRRAEQSR